MVLGCLLYQADRCADLVKIKPEAKILNAACKEDPAFLGRTYGATNLDIQEYDPQTSTDLTRIINYVHGSVLDMPFEAGEFDAIVLGEFLEHCTEEAAYTSFKECHRVLKDKGLLILTFPLDDRPPEEQHAARLLYEHAPGITSWHQTVWTDTMLEALMEPFTFVEVTREELRYGNLMKGWGMVLAK